MKNFLNNKPNQQFFELKPFKKDNHPKNLAIKGNISRSANFLTILYSFSGELDEVLIPQLNINPCRQDELWQTTCCEFFLGLENSSQYWEFNLSPRADWNIYRFTDYRQTRQLETKITTLPLQIKQSTDNWQLELNLNLNPIITTEQNLEIGVTSVIETNSGNLSYWSLIHTAMQPDFHRRDSFIIRI